VLVEFGKEPLAVQKDFERAGPARDQEDPLGQVVGIIVKQMLRQTGGARQIPSGGAVFDPNRVSFLVAVAHRRLLVACRACPSKPAPIAMGRSVAYGAPRPRGSIGGRCCGRRPASAPPRSWRAGGKWLTPRRWRKARRRSRRPPAERPSSPCRTSRPISFPGKARRGRRPTSSTE